MVWKAIDERHETMNLDPLQVSQDLVDFIRKSPTAFHTVANLGKRLDDAGFVRLAECDPWEVRPGGSYYTTRNGSSIIAFKVGEHLDDFHFQMSAAHGDSPSFKVKAVPELVGPDAYVRLNVEPYGGAIYYTWFDKPLSLAGRVMVQDGATGTVRSRLLSFDRDLLIMPSLAIHMKREVNNGFAPDAQVDLCPLFSAGALKEGALKELIADELDVEASRVLAYDLFLVNRQQGSVWGAAQEFVSSPKLDDLQSAFASFEGFLASHNDHDVSVYVCFDNEEVGSGTKQGAKSTFLRDVLHRICAALGKGEEECLRAVASSFMVSFDNAHAAHPNRYAETDAQNHPRLNGGVVIKEHASQLYATDAFSRAVFAAVCAQAGVPVQTFANRSDKRGGSTLGNLSNQQVSVHCVDIGLPQLAMHSSYETAGALDTAWGIEALRAFFDAELRITGDDGATLA
jgi:aspartyl aminopeptidase